MLIFIHTHVDTFKKMTCLKAGYTRLFLSQGQGREILDLTNYNQRMSGKIGLCVSVLFVDAQ